MNLPNLYIPGAGKSGTSSLHEYLHQHPQVFMSRAKEPHYFSRSDYPNGLSEYAQLFADGKNHLYRGESSTSYMVNPKAIERIRSRARDPRFFFLLRNPVERSLSHYWWLKGMGYESLSFQDAFSADRQMEPDFEKDFRDGFVRHYYYQMGCYSKWLEPFLNAFGKDAVCILTTEQLYKTPLETLNLCAAFLNIEPFTEVVSEKKNKTMILKHPTLYHWVASLGWGDSPTRILKSLIPARFQGTVSSWRRKMLDGLKEKMSSDESYSKPTEELRRWVIEAYQEDVAILRNLTGMRFKEWEKDFPV